MKYVVFVGDGMADLPVTELGNKTPLEAAHKPNMDFIASHGKLGMVKTVPDGIKPGSDVANLSVMGFDPLKYYTGRSPLEAYSIGVDMIPGDISFRCILLHCRTMRNTKTRQWLITAPTKLQRRRHAN